MLLGHYGVAFAAKRAIPRTSLGTLTLATQLLDEIWPILLIAGIEQVRVVPGLMAANPLDFVYYPYTHSLAAAIVWSIVLGTIYFLIRRDRRSATIIGALVLSHWVLDLPMHRPDLQLWPGSSVRVGLGAWRSIPLTIVLELAVFLGGLAIYLRTTRPRDGVGSWSLWSMVVVLLLIFLSGFVSAPPPNGRAVGYAALGIWLFVPWSYWFDRHRDTIQTELHTSH
jgi:LexA-binding, inner membrane-associated putative hydrolase